MYRRIYIYIYIYIYTYDYCHYKHLFGADCQTIRLPLHSWALDRQSFPED